uniref:Endonuclease/exonuclease/phosphatase domain-containing protein n=1 Tax=viral metagenome TaxID=1070528 RepID=A0A6C0IBD0_9ZZZZ
MNIFLYKRYRKIHKTADGILYVLYKKDKIYIAKYFKKNGVVKKEHKHLIQQKSKKVGGVNEEKKVAVCLLNVYSWNGYNTRRSNFIDKFKVLIEDKQVDLLLTQEDQHDIKYDTSESVKAYSLKEEKDTKRFVFNMCISTSLQFCKGIVPRNAIIIKDTRFGITIANLHLEGGRFVDTELDDATFKIYLDIKLELLRKVLNERPNIISGDFNSVFCEDPELLIQMYYDQIAYYDVSCSKKATSSSFPSEDDDDTEGSLTAEESGLQKNLGVYLIQKCPNNCGDKGKATLSKDQIISWNNAPFELLQKADYEYIQPKNIKTGEKINPTNSRGNNVIDHFWVHKLLRGKYAFSTEIYDGFGEIKDNLYGDMTDHKPLILTIKRKDAKQGTHLSKRQKVGSK